MIQQRLLHIAVEAFGRHGLEGASTREIAKAAGTAMSSITYHYGGKEGLYLAAASYVADQMLAEFTEVTIFEKDAEKARDALRTAARQLVAKLQHPQSDGWALFIMREQMSPTEGFERIYSGPMGSMLGTMVELICVATGIDDRDAARLMAISLYGQALVLKFARATCYKVLACDTLMPEVLSDYADRLAANVDASLDRMILEQREPSLLDRADNRLPGTN